MVKAAPKDMKNMTKLIKDIQLRKSETKYKSILGPTEALNHDSRAINELKLLSNTTKVFPGQGTDDGKLMGLGDRIYLRGIRVKMNLDVPFDRKNVKVKAYFVPYNTDQGSPTNYSDLFHNITGNNRLDHTACGTAPGTNAGSGVKASNDTFHRLIDLRIQQM